VAFSRARGTPALPRKLFENALCALPDEAMIVGAWYQDQMIGGMLRLSKRDTVYAPWVFSLDEHLNRYPNHLMYWDTIEYAVSNGFHWIDFGRSQVNSGQHQFKRKWSPNEVPVYQQFYLHRAQSVPLTAHGAQNGRGRLLTQIWTHLPISVTRLIGPHIRRELPFV
jgi:predicted N-acyltransferase